MIDGAAYITQPPRPEREPEPPTIGECVLKRQQQFGANDVPKARRAELMGELGGADA